MHITAASQPACPLWARCHTQNQCQVVATQRSGSSPRCPCKPHPQPPRRGGLPTSAAGRYICNGLQGWSWLRLIPDVDSPGMCLLSNCPASEGSHPLLFIRPCLCCTPARERAARGGLPPFPQLVPEQPQPGPGPARWGAALSSSLVHGVGEREVSAHPPSFFLGPGTGGQREKLWKTHYR